MNIVIFYCRRNKVAAAARKTWPGNVIPTFRNDKENTKRLDDLVEQLEPECCLPCFGRDAIRQHILSCLTERRRNIKKGYDYETVSDYSKYSTHVHDLECLEMF
jgi:hypothetical protein